MRNQLCILEATGYDAFGPLTELRPVFDLRCGILLLREKMRAYYGDVDLSLHCRAHLQPLVEKRASGIPVNRWPAGPALLVDGRIVADPELPRRLPLTGAADVVFTCEGEPVAARVNAETIERLRSLQPEHVLAELRGVLPAEPVAVHLVRWPWDLIAENARAISRDFWKLVSLETGDFHRGHVDPGVTLLHAECIRIGTGSHLQGGAVVDGRGGPVYIGRDVTVMPNAVIEGPAAIGDGSVVKAHARIYAATTIGPVCKVGGEIDASMIHGYSNKQHDGFLGHSYLGEWVNVGAGTNNSDLKNNYGSVRVTIGGRTVDTGHMFVGLTMGDHSKSGIGTNFNTGAVVGTCCNVFGGGLPPKYIPSFSWGGAEGLVTYDIERAIVVARTVMARRGVEFGIVEEAALRQVFERTAAERERAGVTPVAAELAPAMAD